MPKRPARVSRAARSSRRAVEAPLAPGPAPPLARDPWAWLCVAAVLPLVLHSLGAPLGEPVLDDFYLLHHALLSGSNALLDGGGLQVYWRPLARQVYFAVLGGWVLDHPRWVAALHVLLLAATTVLLYRALRRGWPGPWAAAAASFPLFLESSRMLISWPSHFQDLGVLLFSALALHEAAFRRLPSALAALLAALLCKEVAVFAALLMPWMPGAVSERRFRLRLALASAAVVAAWAGVYAFVFHRAKLLAATALDPHTLEASLPVRAWWALHNGARDALNLSAVSPAWQRGIALALAVIAAAAALRFAASRSARARLARSAPWVAWGLIWFAGSAAALADLYPAWATYRSSFCAFGLGVASAVLLGAAHSGLLAALVALRLVSFAASPGPPREITQLPAETGAAFDFPKLIRLQRVAVAARRVLAERYPSLPQGSRVGQHYLPRLVEAGFEGDKALQVWYRDTTLRWVRFEEFREHPELPLVTFVEYQPHRTPQMARVDPEAMRSLLRASDRVGRGEWREALAELARADSLQDDRNAAIFLGTIAGKRALSDAGLERWPDAERQARAGLALWPDNTDSRYALAYLNAMQRRVPQAMAELDTLLAADPNDERAQTLRRWVLEAAGRGTR